MNPPTRPILLGPQLLPSHSWPQQPRTCWQVLQAVGPVGYAHRSSVRPTRAGAQEVPGGPHLRMCACQTAFENAGEG